MGAHPAEFTCATCKEKYCDDGGLLPGSLGPAPYPKWAISEIDFESRTCPLPMVDDFSRYLLDLYNWFDAKILPFAGGILDQPYFFIESMKIIKGYLLEQELKRKAKS